MDTSNKHQNKIDTPWLDQSIIILKGIGSKLLERFAKRSLFTLNDLLFHLPIRYQDKTRIIPIADLHVSDHALISGKLIHCEVQTARRSILTCKINDDTGIIELRFFHFKHQQVQSLKRALEQGKSLRCFGEIKRNRYSLEIFHPEYQIIESHQAIPLANSFTPVYPTTEGLSQHILSSAIKQVLEHLRHHPDDIKDFIPEQVRANISCPAILDALFYLHEPPLECTFNELTEPHNIYRQSLVFEELLAHQLTMKQAYEKQKHLKAPILNSSQNKKLQYSRQFINQLPFTLTNAQQQVIQDIKQDICQPHPMQRLIQGDVGSGKTVVSALAALLALENNFQVALMAPTELLAEQHYSQYKLWLEPLKIEIAWLSGTTKSKARKEALAAIASGSALMVIGTHALFQDSVHFNHLGLVIIDEQHRFGVHQRLSLLQKGQQAVTETTADKTIYYYPHQLIMTATPIPRTLAMTAYADLDCSIINELPPGRTPIETIVLSEARRQTVMERVHQACLKGRQAYWVCTLIEESEVLQCQAAEKTYAELSAQFPDLSIGLVHGRLSAHEKQAIMASFKQGKLALLIATTVIEVGVDVPNASLMIIENAERLGLSQLHQLRGRVGRGSQASVCALIHGSPLSKNAKARLMTLRETSDGFEVARKDLALRGPGEVLGTRQTGLAEMKIADIIEDQHLIAEVNQIALQLIRYYPDNIQPIIDRWIGTKREYQNV